MKYQVIRDENGVVVMVAVLSDDSEGLDTYSGGGIAMFSLDPEAKPELEIYDVTGWSVGDDPQGIEPDDEGRRAVVTP